MRQNGLGTLTFEDVRTWIEETGLCLFLPRRQFSSSVAPSFVEAVAGKRDETPDPSQIATAEELLVRLELADVAVRLNLQGLPGEQPDFVVASWVLPYVYALRGDRDWRRTPQLTGSRAVSPLAVQAYKNLETGDATVSQLRQSLGREVSESAVVRAITELWQQLRIVPVISAPGQPAKWQLLKHRFQKAIAEGASTSQVTAISVLASIYLQAVIAASMEDVEVFLSSLTARSKVREVLRGLVATRQVHTITLGHSPHFYVAGTLPEFPAATSIYSNGTFGSTESGYNYSFSGYEHRERRFESAPERPVVSPVVPAIAAQAEPAAPVAPAAPRAEVKPVEEKRPEPRQESHAPRTPVRKPAAAGKSAPARPHSRPAPHMRDRKPGTSRPGTNRPSTSRTGTGTSRPSSSSSRASASRPSSSRPGASSTSGSRNVRHGEEPRSASGASRWAKNSPAKSNGNHAASGNSGRTNGSSNGSRPKTTGSAKPASSWAKSNGHAKSVKPAGKSTAGAHKSGMAHKAGSNGRKPALAAGAKAGNSKRYGFTARPKQGSKKRG
jgi:23S rRNA pseudouridine2605 synthase